MKSYTCVEQRGVVEEINDGFAKVSIISFSACAHCVSKEMCNLTDSATREISAPVEDLQITEGETVRVIMKRVLGLKASLLAYFYPFILVILSVLILTAIHLSELASGLISLGILVPYFFVLYLFRERLKRTFTFTLQKEN